MVLKERQEILPSEDSRDVRDGAEDLRCSPSLSMSEQYYAEGCSCSIVLTESAHQHSGESQELLGLLLSRDFTGKVEARALGKSLDGFDV